MTQTAGGPRPSDKWIPWYIALFFVVLVATILPMAWIAIKTMPGTVTEHSYEKGLAYNKTLAAAAQTKQLGWQGALTATTTERKAQLDYTLRDATGRAIEDAAVTAYLTRPMQNGMDQTAKLAHVGGGRYEATTELASKGVWDVAISATRGGDHFQTKQRIEAK